MQEEKTFREELLENIQNTPFENLSNSLDFLSGQCAHILMHVISLLKSEIEGQEKIKLLNAIKNTILFELIYSENYATYKAATGKKIQPKKNLIIDENASKEDSSFNSSESFKKALDYFSLPVFNSEINYDRSCYLQMTEVIENSVLEALMNKNLDANIEKAYEKSGKTKYTRQKMGVLIKLLQEQKIVPDSKSKASSFLNILTGFSTNTQQREIPDEIEYIDYIQESTFEEIKADLKQMIRNLEIMNGENKRIKNQ